jgi:hypothetical protein
MAKGLPALPDIPVEQRTPLVEALLAIIRAQQDRIGELEETVQRLRDGIEHREGHAAIPFERMGAGEEADFVLFVVGEPVVAWHPGVVLVDLAEALLPVVELAGTDADPGQEARDGDVGLVSLQV